MCVLCVCVCVCVWGGGGGGGGGGEEDGERVSSFCTLLSQCVTGRQSTSDVRTHSKETVYWNTPSLLPLTTM